MTATSDAFGVTGTAVNAAQGGDSDAAAPGPLAMLRELLTSTHDRGRAQRDAVIVFAVRVASAALLYLSQIVLARWLGGHEYGIYVFVWTWVLILGGLAHSGLNLASMRLAPVYREHREFEALRGLIRGGRFAALAGGTIVMAAGLAGVALFGEALQSHYVLPLYLALVCIPLYALTDIQDGLGRGLGWMRLALAPPYLLRPLLLLSLMIAAKFAGFAMTAETAASAAIVATWSTGLIQALIFNARVRETIPEAPREYRFKEWFGAAMPMVFIVAAELVLQNADVIVISTHLSPTDAGIYFAAGKTMALIMFVHYAVGSAVAHKFAALYTRGDHEGLRDFVRDSVNWTFWPSLAGALLILLLGKPLLWLFGPQFDAGYPIMCTLVVGFLFRAAMGPAEYLLNMIGAQHVCAAVMIAAAAMNIALNLTLVPAHGIEGAAIATALSLMAAATMCSIAVWRRLGIHVAIWHNLPWR